MLAWMDLEMTGLDPARHVIVEIATLLTDDELGRSPRARTSSCTRQPKQLDGMDDVVRSMHTRSGLAAAIQSSRVSLAEAGAQTLEFLRATSARPGRSRCAATRSAPTGAFWRPSCPRSRTSCTTARSTCRPSRSSAAAGIPDVLAGAPPKREAHRALDDIRESIAELAYYRSTIFIRRDHSSTIA